MDPSEADPGRSAVVGVPIVQDTESEFRVDLGPIRMDTESKLQNPILVVPEPVTDSKMGVKSRAAKKAAVALMVLMGLCIMIGAHLLYHGFNWSAMLAISDSGIEAAAAAKRRLQTAPNPVPVLDSRGNTVINPTDSLPYTVDPITQYDPNDPDTPLTNSLNEIIAFNPVFVHNPDGQPIRPTYRDGAQQGQVIDQNTWVTMEPVKIYDANALNSAGQAQALTNPANGDFYTLKPVAVKDFAGNPIYQYQVDGADSDPNDPLVNDWVVESLGPIFLSDNNGVMRNNANEPLGLSPQVVHQSDGQPLRISNPGNSDDNQPFTFGPLLARNPISNDLVTDSAGNYFTIIPDVVREQITSGEKSDTNLGSVVRDANSNNQPATISPIVITDPVSRVMATANPEGQPMALKALLVYDKSGGVNDGKPLRKGGDSESAAGAPSATNTGDFYTFRPRIATNPPNHPTDPGAVAAVQADADTGLSICHTYAPSALRKRDQSVVTEGSSRDIKTLDPIPLVSETNGTLILNGIGQPQQYHPTQVWDSAGDPLTNGIAQVQTLSPMTVTKSNQQPFTKDSDGNFYTWTPKPVVNLNRDSNGQITDQNPTPVTDSNGRPSPIYPTSIDHNNDGQVDTNSAKFPIAIVPLQVFQPENNANAGETVTNNAGEIQTMLPQVAVGPEMNSQDGFRNPITGDYYTHNPRALTNKDKSELITEAGSGNVITLPPIQPISWNSSDNSVDTNSAGEPIAMHGVVVYDRAGQPVFGGSDNSVQTFVPKIAEYVDPVTNETVPLTNAANKEPYLLKPYAFRDRLGNPYLDEQGRPYPVDPIFPIDHDENDIPDTNNAGEPIAFSPWPVYDSNDQLLTDSAGYVQLIQPLVAENPDRSAMTDSKGDYYTHPPIVLRDADGNVVTDSLERPIPLTPIYPLDIDKDGQFDTNSAGQPIAHEPVVVYDYRNYACDPATGNCGYNGDLNKYLPAQPMTDSNGTVQTLAPLIQTDASDGSPVTYPPAGELGFNKKHLAGTYKTVHPVPLLDKAGNPIYGSDLLVFGQDYVDDIIPIAPILVDFDQDGNTDRKFEEGTRDRTNGDLIIHDPILVHDKDGNPITDAPPAEAPYNLTKTLAPIIVTHPPGEGPAPGGTPLTNAKGEYYTEMPILFTNSDGSPLTHNPSPYYDANGVPRYFVTAKPRSITDGADPPNLVTRSDGSPIDPLIPIILTNPVSKELLTLNPDHPDYDPANPVATQFPIIVTGAAPNNAPLQDPDSGNYYTYNPFNVVDRNGTYLTDDLGQPYSIGPIAVTDPNPPNSVLTGSDGLPILVDPMLVYGPDGLPIGNPPDNFLTLGPYVHTDANGTVWLDSDGNPLLQPPNIVYDGDGNPLDGNGNPIINGVDFYATDGPSSGINGTNNCTETSGSTVGCDNNSTNGNGGNGNGNNGNGNGNDGNGDDGNGVLTLAPIIVTDGPGGNPLLRGKNPLTLDPNLLRDDNGDPILNNNGGDNANGGNNNDPNARVSPVTVPPTAVTDPASGDVLTNSNGGIITVQPIIEGTSIDPNGNIVVRTQQPVIPVDAEGRALYDSSGREYLPHLRVHCIGHFAGERSATNQAAVKRQLVERAVANVYVNLTGSPEVKVLNLTHDVVVAGSRRALETDESDTRGEEGPQQVDMESTGAEQQYPAVEQAAGFLSKGRAPILRSLQDSVTNFESETGVLSLGGSSGTEEDDHLHLKDTQNLPALETSLISIAAEYGLTLHGLRYEDRHRNPLEHPDLTLTYANMYQSNNETTPTPGPVDPQGQDQGVGNSGSDSGSSAGLIVLFIILGLFLPVLLYFFYLKYEEKRRADELSKTALKPQYLTMIGEEDQKPKTLSQRMQLLKKKLQEYVHDCEFVLSICLPARLSQKQSNLEPDPENPPDDIDPNNPDPNASKAYKKLFRQHNATTLGQKGENHNEKWWRVNALMTMLGSGRNFSVRQSRKLRGQQLNQSQLQSKNPGGPGQLGYANQNAGVVSSRMGENVDPSAKFARNQNVQSHIHQGPQTAKAGAQAQNKELNRGALMRTNAGPLNSAAPGNSAVLGSSNNTGVNNTGANNSRSLQSLQSHAPGANAANALEDSNNGNNLNYANNADGKKTEGQQTAGQQTAGQQAGKKFGGQKTAGDELFGDILKQESDLNVAGESPGASVIKDAQNVTPSTTMARARKTLEDAFKGLSPTLGANGGIIKTGDQSKVAGEKAARAAALKEQLGLMKKNEAAIKKKSSQESLWEQRRSLEAGVGAAAWPRTPARGSAESLADLEKGAQNGPGIVDKGTGTLDFHGVKVRRMQTTDFDGHNSLKRKESAEKLKKKESLENVVKKKESAENVLQASVAPSLQASGAVEIQRSKKWKSIRSKSKRGNVSARGVAPPDKGLSQSKNLDQSKPNLEKPGTRGSSDEQPPSNLGKSKPSTMGKSNDVTTNLGKSIPATGAPVAEGKEKKAPQTKRSGRQNASGRHSASPRRDPSRSKRDDLGRSKGEKLDRSNKGAEKLERSKKDETVDRSRNKKDEPRKKEDERKKKSHHSASSGDSNPLKHLFAQQRQHHSGREFFGSPTAKSGAEKKASKEANLEDETKNEPKPKAAASQPDPPKTATPQQEPKTAGLQPGPPKTAAPQQEPKNQAQQMAVPKIPQQIQSIYGFMENMSLTSNVLKTDARLSLTSAVSGVTPADPSVPPSARGNAPVRSPRASARKSPRGSNVKR